MFGFNTPSKEVLEKELEGLDKALDMLKERYEKKVINLEGFSKQCEEMRRKREKILKQLEKYN